jgi:hypothetical protein
MHRTISQFAKKTLDCRQLAEAAEGRDAPFRRLDA